VTVSSYYQSIILKHLKPFFLGGLGRSGVDRKNYTTGDKGYLGFEGTIRCILEDAKNVEYLIEFDQEYLDGQRLDFHVTRNKNLVALLETRSWVDKPFLQQKYQVFQKLEKYGHLKDGVTAAILMLELSIADETLKEIRSDHQLKHHPYLITLSLGKRDKNDGYFRDGIDMEGVSKFANILNHIYTVAEGELIVPKSYVSCLPI
jgi:hypothetical protein